MPSLPYLAPIVMLALSNVFMTFAWYGHLKFGAKPLWIVVLISWGIAFFEYWLAVPANRIGHQVYSAAELKTMQEVITLLVFAVFSVAWLGEKLTVNHLIGFALIAGGAFFIFKGPLCRVVRPVRPRSLRPAFSDARRRPWGRGRGPSSGGRPSAARCGNAGGRPSGRPRRR